MTVRRTTKRSERDRLLADVGLWKTLRASDPDEYRVILESACRGSYSTRETLPTDVAQIATSDVIEQTNSPLVVAPSKRSATQACLLSYVENYVVPVAQDPRQFCSAIFRLAETSHVLSRVETYRFSFAALDAIYGKRLLAILPTLHARHSCVWEVLPVFWDLLPGLEADAGLLIQNLPRIHDIVGEDLIAGVFHGSVREFGEFHPETAKLVSVALLDEGTQSAAEMASCLMVGAARTRPRHMYDVALELSESSHATSASAAIVALSNMDYSNPTLGGHVERFMEKLRVLESNEHLVGAVALAYCNLARQGHELEDKLVQLSQQTDPVARHHLSSLLLGRSQKEDDEHWIRICLMNLASTTNLSHARTLKNLDGTLSRLVRSDTSVANRFLTRWALENSEGLERHPIHEPFRSTFLQLLGRREPLEFLVTAWLNTDLLPLHRAAAQMLREATLVLSVQADLPLVLSTQVLTRISSINRVFILRKVLGWAYDIDNTSLFAFAFSVLQGADNDPLLERQVAAAFGNALGYDYPHSCEEYLKGLGESEGSITQRVATAALSKIEAYRKARVGRPYLKELVPPSDRLAQYNREVAKAMARSYKRARDEKPGLLQLVQRSTLKFKCPYVFAGPDGELRRGELHEHSETMELPRGDSIAPIGHAVMLAKFRVETKAEVRSELEEREG